VRCSTVAAATERRRRETILFRHFHHESSFYQVITMFSVALRQCSRSAAVRSSISRASPRVFANASEIRSMSTTVEEEVLASDAFKKSCYVAIDFTIPEEATVYDAVQRFSAYDIGALVTTDPDGKQLDSTDFF
jgi:hypothetical protein